MIAVTVRFTMHILSMVAVCSGRNILHTRYSLLEIGRFLILLRVHHSIGHPSIELFQGVITMISSLMRHCAAAFNESAATKAVKSRFLLVIAFCFSIYSCKITTFIVNKQSPDISIFVRHLPPCYGLFMENTDI